MIHTPKTIIRFEPLIPVRNDVIGERIFTSEWQYLVGGKRATVLHWAENGKPRWEEFEELGTHRDTLWPQNHSFYRSMTRIGPSPTDLTLPQLWQRRASVATSFVKWLGTNLGRTFLEDVDKTYAAMQTAHIHPNYRSSAYTMVWAQRNNDTDGKQRLAIVAENYVPDVYGFGVIGKYSCSYDDIRVIEEMAAWLGTDSGQGFIKTCRAKIDRAVKRDKLKRHAAENARLIGLGFKPVSLPQQVFPIARKRAANLTK